MSWPIRNTRYEVHVPMSVAQGMCQDSIKVHEARIAALREALGRAIDFCDAATHGDNQYSDERSNLIRVWRGESKTGSADASSRRLASGEAWASEAPGKNDEGC